MKITLVYFAFIITCILIGCTGVTFLEKKNGFRDSNTSILGSWKYMNSKSSERTITLEKLGDLPLEIEFFQCITKCKIESTNPLNKIKERSVLKDVWSKHSKMPFGDKTYVILVEGVNGQKKVTHYNVQGDKCGETFSYFIVKQSNDSLVIRNERLYDVDGTKQKLDHLYIKQ